MQARRQAVPDEHGPMREAAQAARKRGVRDMLRPHDLPGGWSRLRDARRRMRRNARLRYVHRPETFGGSGEANVCGVPSCTPGTVGCGWEDGDMVSYSQDSWGGDPTMNAAAALLLAQFNFRYPAGVEVGISGAAGFSLAFTSASAILDYQPASGTFAALNSDLLDPTSSASGAYGGFVLALQLDVDFTDSGNVSGTSGLLFGDLRLCGLTTTPAYNGMTVRQFLGEMNVALGAGPAAYSFFDMAFLTSDVTTAFEGGSVSLFAQQHLFNGACP